MIKTFEVAPLDVQKDIDYIYDLDKADLNLEKILIKYLVVKGIKKRNL